MDWGASTARALVIAPDTRHSLVRASGGLLTAIGPVTFANRLSTLVRSGLSLVMPHDDATCEFEIGIGLAGFNWPDESAEYHSLCYSALSSLGPNLRLTIANDTRCALLADFSCNWGIAIVSGTGCNCRGWDISGNEYRAVGVSRYFGENGSGTDLTEYAIEIAATEWTQRIAPSQLTEALVSYFDVQDRDALIRLIANGVIVPDAGFAKHVLMLAEEGEPNAHFAAARLAQNLASLVLRVSHSLPAGGAAVKVVGAGSILQKSPTIQRYITNSLARMPVSFSINFLKYEPVIGALRLPHGPLNTAVFPEAVLHECLVA